MDKSRIFSTSVTEILIVLVAIFVLGIAYTYLFDRYYFMSSATGYYERCDRTTGVCVFLNART